MKRCLAIVVLFLHSFSTTVAAADDVEQPNVDCANATSTAELNYCADAEFNKADAELNKVFKSALAAIPEMAAEPPYDTKSWENALRASQRAWLAFRDSECVGHVSMFWGGGSGTSADVIGCKTALTEARTKQLAERYERK